MFVQNVNYNVIYKKLWSSQTSNKVFQDLKPIWNMVSFLGCLIQFGFIILYNDD